MSKPIFAPVPALQCDAIMRSLGAFQYIAPEIAGRLLFIGGIVLMIVLGPAP